MISADLSGINKFAGSVAGILNAIESPGFQGDFTGTIMDRLKEQFMIDAIAANESGYANIKHVFEWGDRQGEPSNIPLFKLTKNGRGGSRYLSYIFLPSTKHVPLPDPARYGFNPNKVQFMHRHIFRMKALVMETQSNVTVSPRYSKRLFVPAEGSKYGYYMTSRPVEINPGGAQATGGFAQFWLTWFESRAQAIVDTETRKAEEIIAATGQKVIRYAAGTSIGGRSVGGQFATGRSVGIGYTERSAQSRMASELKRYYDDNEGDE